MDPATLQRLAAIIEEGTSFLHVTHVNPDADGLGSALAMHRWLVRRGKTSQVVVPSPVPRRLAFLPRPGEVRVLDTPEAIASLPEDASFMLYDFSTLSRLGPLEGVVRASKRPRVVFDHHDGAIEFETLAFNDAGSAATAQLLADLFEAWGVEIDLDLALPLYVGLISDSGSFNYGKTTPHTHEVAGRLLAAGVQPLEVHGLLEGSKQAAAVRVAGQVMTTITVDAKDPRIASMVLPLKQWEEGGAEAIDAVDLVNQTIAIEGVRAGLMCIGIAPDRTRLSFRSKGTTSIIETAKSFGGGGHRNAAGATVEGPVDSVYPKVLDRLRQDIAEQLGPA